MKSGTDAERRSFVVDNLQAGSGKKEIILALALSLLFEKTPTEIDAAFMKARNEFNMGFQSTVLSNRE